MKCYLVLFLLLLKISFGYSQNTISLQQRANSVLVKLSEKISSFKNIRYDNTRELNYSSENYRYISKWTGYYDFQSNDTIIGFKYQIDDTTSKQIFNGTERFDLNKKAKTISVNDHPDKSIFNSLQVLYNSIITLRSVLPLLISDNAAIKYVSDTLINNTLYNVISINIGKRRIQNLGLGFDAMTTKSNFIYKIIVAKNSGLPFQVIQTNDLNSDFIKTVFTNIKTNIATPSELSWYYSTYKNDYKLAGETPKKQLLSKGSLAPQWTLNIYNNNKSISLGQLKGQVILIDFWIKNCGPCIQSVPYLNELQSKFKDKNFTLISINSYDSKQDVHWFCKKYKGNYTVLLNGKSVAEKYGVSGFPTFVVIDKAGKIIYSNAGYSGSIKSEVESVIAAAL